MVKFDVCDLVRSRLRHNQNALIAMTGQTGTGKSMCGLEFARLIDPDFTAEKVVFTVKDFLELLKTLNKGEVVVFDEAGVDFDARRSSSKKNVFFSNVLKTFRYRNIPTIFTLPHLAMLDKNARRLFHYWVKTHSIDYERSICWTRFYVINSEDDWSDILKRYMVRVYDPITHEKRCIVRVGFRKPPQKLVDDYEAKKHEYVTAMLEDMQEKMDKGDGGGEDDMEPSMKDLRNKKKQTFEEEETEKKEKKETKKRDAKKKSETIQLDDDEYKGEILDASSKDMEGFEDLLLS
jgi:hypothetical protein